MTLVSKSSTKNKTKHLGNPKGDIFYYSRRYLYSYLCLDMK